MKIFLRVIFLHYFSFSSFLVVILIIIIKMILYQMNFVITFKRNTYLYQYINEISELLNQYYSFIQLYTKLLNQILD